MLAHYAISVVCEKSVFARDALFVKKIAKKVLPLLFKKSCSVSLFLVSEKTMALVNKQTRGIARPTNVFSFREPRGFIAPKSNTLSIGEMYVCTPYIKKYSVPFPLDFLVLHGLLHLAGYDHHKKSETALMEKKERFLCKKTGINYPYA